jgi:hypothetical protein
MDKKTKGRKNYPLEAKEVAAILNVSESIVKKVRTSETSGVSLKTQKQKLVQMIDVWAEQNKSNFITEIKKIVNL